MFTDAPEAPTTPMEVMLNALDDGLHMLETAHDGTMREAAQRYALLARLERRVQELEYRLRWYEANVPAMREARRACDRAVRASRVALKHGVLRTDAATEGR